MEKEKKDYSFEIDRAKIQIQKNHPFFALLSLYLKFELIDEDDLKLNDSLGMGVNIKGEVIYKGSFIESINELELQGTIIHEICHLALRHLDRESGRNHLLFNIACDMVVNQIIKENEIKLPKGCIWSDRDGNVEVFSKIFNVIGKSAEELYNELINEFGEDFDKGDLGDLSFGDGGNSGDSEDSEDSGTGIGKLRFDKHIRENDKLSEEERNKLMDKWKERLMDSYVASQMRGDTPLGIEILIGKIHKEKVNWKNLLKNSILNSIPYDYCYSKPHKKSISSGFYMPDVKKENIKITAVLDLSGSVGQEELTDFISEIVGMAKSYREKITFRILTHDVEVHNDYLVENGNVNKILKLKIEGGGGTSHIEVFNYIKDKYKDTELVIFLTDGYSDLEEIKFDDYKFNKIFVINKKGSEKFKNCKNCKNCKTIKLN